MRKKERIYGEDTGNLSPEFISDLNRMLEVDPKRAEALIYLTILKLKWAKINADYIMHSRLLNNNGVIIWRFYGVEGSYAEFYLMYQTRHFGVVIEKESYFKSHPSESYDKWYDFWQNHINTLKRDDLDKFELAIHNDDDISSYLPTREWNEE